MGVRSTQAGLFHVGCYRFHAASSGIGSTRLSTRRRPEGLARDPSQDVRQGVDGGDQLAAWTTAFFSERHVRLLLGSSSCGWLDCPG
jgi:hypothetical protein